MAVCDTRPMERSEMLKSLSHDHHQALRMAQLMRRTDESNATEALEGFDRFWAQHQSHLQIEETVLFPKYAEFSGEGDPQLKQALGEHDEVRSLAETVLAADNPPLDTMHELAEALSDHVRFEERELFPAIESAIPEDQHAALLHALEHAETSPDWQPSRQPD